ncbi:MAG: glycosyltransferase [bacterium]
MIGESWFSIDPAQSAHLAANRDCFAKRYPAQAAGVLAALPRLPAYEFLEIGRQQFAVRHKEDGCFLYDPADFQTRLQNALDRALTFYQRGAELLIIAGAGLGYLAAHLEPHIQGRNQAGLLLLEPAPELMIAQWCLFDCRPLIESPRIIWAAGRPLLSVTRPLIEEERLDLVPGNRLAFVPERILSEEEKQELQALASWFGERGRARKAEMVQKQASYRRCMARPADLASGRVWSAATPEAYAHTPLLRSLLAGFEAAGWRSRLLEIRDGFATRYRVSEDLMETAPDLIVVCNSASGAFFSKDIRRPRISWILDHPRYYGSDALVRDLSWRDHVFVIDRKYLDFFAESPAGACQFLPATSCLTTPGIHRNELAYPILFAGSYQEVTPVLRRFSGERGEELQAVIQYLIDHPTVSGGQALEILAVSEAAREQLAREARPRSAHLLARLPDTTRQVDYWLYSLANSFKRERTVRILLELGVVVYGPPAWLSVLGPRYASRYKGWLAAEDLPDAYASAQVSLNIHSLQCPTCLNPRDFDILAAGGCLVTDWVKDLDAGLIRPGEDCLAYHSENDLLPQVDGLLHDEERRDAMARRGRSTWENRHTPAHRAGAMLDVIRRKYREE